MSGKNLASQRSTTTCLPVGVLRGFRSFSVVDFKNLFKPIIGVARHWFHVTPTFVASPAVCTVRRPICWCQWTLDVGVYSSFQFSYFASVLMVLYRGCFKFIVIFEVISAVNQFSKLLWLSAITDSG